MTLAGRHDFEISDPARLVADPAVSVGIIAYNHERYLAQAIESVLAQRTSFPFDVFVYEDCSTDGTRELALDYQRRFPEQVRVLYSDENVGMGQNVRRGIAGIRGRYAAGCDGDDYWNDPLKLQKQFDALEANPDVNLCFSRGKQLSPDGSVKTAWSYGRIDRIVSARELLRTPGMLAPTASLFFRADVLRATPEWIFGAPVIDVFHILAGSTPAGAYYLADDTVTYRVMAEGSWSSFQDANYHAVKLEHSRRMISSYDEAARSFGVPRRHLRMALSVPYYLLGRAAFAKGDYAQAIRHFSRVSAKYVGMQLRDLPRRFRAQR